MTDPILLYVIGMTIEQADRLGAELAPLPQVTVVRDYSDAQVLSGGLDAIFVPLMSALEWGCIKPPAPRYQTRVVEMPDYEIARGQPRYAIPGVAIGLGDTLKPVDCTRLVLRESFRAIRHFNQTNSCKLRKVGAPSLSLGLEELKVGDVLPLISEAYAMQAP